MIQTSTERLTQESPNYDPQRSPVCFRKQQFYSNTATPITLGLRLLSAATAEASGCHTDHVTHEPKIFTLWLLGTSLLTATLGQRREIPEPTYAPQPFRDLLKSGFQFFLCYLPLLWFTVNKNHFAVP